MRDWRQVSVAADIDVYFCDPHAPWQRATGENTNGLLRQYFPTGTDMSVHSAVDPDWVATELNDQPRKRLGFAKPIEEIGPLLHAVFNRRGRCGHCVERHLSVCGGAAGSCTVTQSPPAARGVRVRVPSCAWVMLVTIARPRPTPAWSVRVRLEPR